MFSKAFCKPVIKLIAVVLEALTHHYQTSQKNQGIIGALAVPSLNYLQGYFQSLRSA